MKFENPAITYPHDWETSKPSVAEGKVPILLPLVQEIGANTDIHSAVGGTTDMALRKDYARMTMGVLHDFIAQCRSRLRELVVTGPQGYQTLASTDRTFSVALEPDMITVSRAVNGKCLWTCSASCEASPDNPYAHFAMRVDNEKPGLSYSIDGMSGAFRREGDNGHVIPETFTSYSIPVVLLDVLCPTVIRIHNALSYLGCYSD